MLAWNDAWTVDESRRRDKLVESEVDLDRKGLHLASLLFGGCVVLAFVLFLLDKWQGGIALVGAPVLLFLARMLGGRDGRGAKEQ